MFLMHWLPVHKWPPENQWILWPPHKFWFHSGILVLSRMLLLWISMPYLRCGVDGWPSEMEFERRFPLVFQFFRSVAVYMCCWQVFFYLHVCHSFSFVCVSSLFWRKSCRFSAHSVSTKVDVLCSSFIQQLPHDRWFGSQQTVLFQEHIFQVFADAFLPLWIWSGFQRLLSTLLHIVELKLFPSKFKWRFSTVDLRLNNWGHHHGTATDSKCFCLDLIKQFFICLRCTVVCNWSIIHD